MYNLHKLQQVTKPSKKAKTMWKFKAFCDSWTKFLWLKSFLTTFQRIFLISLTPEVKIGFCNNVECCCFKKNLFNYYTCFFRIACVIIENVNETEIFCPCFEIFKAVESKIRTNWRNKNNIDWCHYALASMILT